MIAFEVAFIFVVAIVLVVAIASLGKPLAEAYAEKLKTKFREIGSQEAHVLRERLQSLEGEIVEMRSQLKAIQESNDYTVKLLESSQNEQTKQIQDEK